jgi:hypothetical protein
MVDADAGTWHLLVVQEVGDPWLLIESRAEHAGTRPHVLWVRISLEDAKQGGTLQLNLSVAVRNVNGNKGFQFSGTVFITVYQIGAFGVSLARNRRSPKRPSEPRGRAASTRKRTQ